MTDLCSGTAIASDPPAGAPGASPRAGPDVDTGRDAGLRLSAATTVPAACEASVDLLVARGVALPSLYLQRGGLLRCLASRGYWQVLDGMPPVSGVIARTVSTGRVTVVDDVAASEDFLEAVPGVRAEVCVPLTVGDSVVGALNVESTTALSPDLLPLVQAVAARLSRRMTALGGPPAESRWQALAREAAVLSGQLERDEVERSTLEAVQRLSGFDSAMIVAVDDAGAPAVRAARGALAPSLRQLDAASLDTIASWVAAARSCYSIGAPDGYGFTGGDSLRTVGVNAVVVLALEARGHRLGFLLAADSSPTLPATDDVEVLELLATHAASCLQTAAAVDELRQRAARDPLTGLGHHAAFGEALLAARDRGEPDLAVAVLLVDVDGFKSVNDTQGHLAGDRLLREMAAGLSDALRTGDRLYRIGGDEFAAVLEVGDEREALAIGERLRAAAHATGRTVSVGVAMSTADQADASLLSGADEALYQVKRTGRDGVRLAT